MVFEPAAAAAGVPGARRQGAAERLDNQQARPRGGAAVSCCHCWLCPCSTAAAGRVHAEARVCALAASSQRRRAALRPRAHAPAAATASRQKPLPACCRVPRRCTPAPYTALHACSTEAIDYVAPWWIVAAAAASCGAGGLAIAALLGNSLGDPTWSVSSGIGALFAGAIFEAGRPARLSVAEAQQLEAQWQDFGARRRRGSTVLLAALLAACWLNCWLLCWRHVLASTRGTAS